MIRVPASIRTERLDLELLTLGDAALMLEIWNDPAFIRNVGDRGIRSIEEAELALRGGPLAMYDRCGYGPYRLTLRETDAAIGICGLFQRDYLDDPDIGFALLPAYHRRGLALEAARVIVDQARSILGLQRLTAIVSPQNAASIALIEKLGLGFEKMITPVGEDQRVCLYAVNWSRAR